MKTKHMFVDKKLTCLKESQYITVLINEEELTLLSHLKQKIGTN